jgi:nucleoid-associated protein YgaU
MHKDFKIGLAVGIAAAAAATVWLCTWPKLSTESRALRAASTPSTGSVEIYKVHEEIPHPKIEQKTAKVELNARFHIIQKGDTLSDISQKYYGTPLYWQKILAANDAVLKDPDRLVPGTRLIIPE